MGKSTALLGYAFFTGITVLATLEVGLRINGAYRTYSEKIGHGYSSYYGDTYQTWYLHHNPDSKAVFDHGEFRFEFLTNSLGLSEREFDEDTGRAVRIFFLGDSFTEGVGTVYDSTYPRQFERNMLRDSMDAAVFNAARSGGDPWYSHVLLRDKLLGYKPTHVISAVNQSDFEDWLFRGGFERFREGHTVVNRKGPWWHGFYRYSHLVRFFVHNILDYDGTLTQRSRIPPLRMQAAVELKACLDSTDRLCRENDIRFLALAFPSPGEICWFKPEDLPIRLLEGLDYGYPFEMLDDAWDSMRESSACPQLGWKTDGHFRGAGYVLMGDLLYADIQQKFPQFLQPAE